MERLNKDALSIFFDNVITPVLKNRSKELEIIDEKMFNFEDAIYQLPFIERRNLYLLEKLLNDEYGLSKAGNENKNNTKELSSDEEFNIRFKIQGREAEIGESISASLLSLTV